MSFLKICIAAIARASLKKVTISNAMINLSAFETDLHCTTAAIMEVSMAEK